MFPLGRKEMIFVFMCSARAGARNIASSIARTGDLEQVSNKEDCEKSLFFLKDSWGRAKNR